MRISVIHGEDSAKSYDKFRNLVDGSRKKNFEIVFIDNIRNIINQSLFEEKQVFVLEKIKKVNVKDWKWFKENADKYNSNLLVFHDGEISATILKNFPKETKFEKFDLPKIIFAFLDSLYPKNSQKSLKLLDELNKTEPTELIFAILSGHFKNLFWAKIQPETMNLPDWRVLKLAKQADKFEVESLKKIISDLSEIDIKAKTSYENLKTLLDLMIIKNLQ